MAISEEIGRLMDEQRALAAKLREAELEDAYEKAVVGLTQEEVSAIWGYIQHLVAEWIVEPGWPHADYVLADAIRNGLYSKRNPTPSIVDVRATNN